MAFNQIKAYSLNNAGLQLKLLKMICKEAERMSIPCNPYTPDTLNLLLKKVGIECFKLFHLKK